VAINTAYNFKITVASSPGSTSQTDLSDHCIALKVNMPQQANESQAAGATHKQYRPGAGDPSIEATFRNDHSTQSIEYVLRQHISMTSTGFGVTARVVNAARSSANPDYSAECVISGDLNVMDHNWGEIPGIGVKFVPFGTFSVTVTTT
jgi:hypothetical protein